MGVCFVAREVGSKEGVVKSSRVRFIPILFQFSNRFLTISHTFYRVGINNA